jgi:hypothetical protein
MNILITLEPTDLSASISSGQHLSLLDSLLLSERAIDKVQCLGIPDGTL